MNQDVAYSRWRYILCIFPPLIWKYAKYYVIWKYHGLTTKKALCSWNWWGSMFSSWGFLRAHCMAFCVNRCRTDVLVFDWASNSNTSLPMPGSMHSQRWYTFLNKEKRVHQFLPGKEGREDEVLYLLCPHLQLNCYQIGREARMWLLGCEGLKKKKEDLTPSFSRITSFLSYLVFHHHRLHWHWEIWNIQKYESHLHPITWHFFSL